MIRIVGVALVGLLWSACGYAALDLIPKPQHVTVGEGVFVLHAGQEIRAPSSARGRWIANYLQRHIATQTGVVMDVVGPDGHGEVSLRIDKAIKGRGAYRVDITRSGVRISAASDRGLFWGAQTFRQLLPVRGSTSIRVPVVVIEDAPRYPWRGVMLDVGRHFYPVSFIKAQIALMSYYKFDVFHWHLTEDQGWRIQIKRYPKLTDIGAWRTEPDGSRYGGFYTDQEIRDVVTYAEKRNVMVVPEIEMPGHISAAIASYPELSCNDKSIDVPTTWGVTRNVACVGKPGTYAFLENVLDEVFKLFPSPYVHIGGDEVPGGVWDDCSSCASLVKTHGFKGDEQGLHGYFVGRMNKFLESKGKTLVGWDEILEGGQLSPKAIVEVWRLPSGMYGGSATTLRDALSNGNRILLSGPYYLNATTDDMTVEDIFRNNAFHDPLFAKYPGKVLGGEAALWSENSTPLSGAARMYPRLLAIAGQFWGSPSQSWPEFRASVHAQEAWLASHGVAYGAMDQNIVDYTTSFNPRYRRWRIHAARGLGEMRMHYTSNGEVPTASSPSFGSVLDVYETSKLQVTPFVGNVQYDVPFAFEFVSGLELGAQVTAAAAPLTRNPDQLVDGVLSGENMVRGSVSQEHAWVVWPESGMDVTVDLGRVQSVRSVAAHFLQASGDEARVPPHVTFAVSANGTTWTRLPVVDLSVSRAKDGLVAVKVARRVLSEPTEMRYVRVNATAPVDGNVYCDEVIVH